MSPIEGAWRAIRRYDLLPAGTRVVAGVSGGADSVALLHVLLELARRGQFVVAGVAHVNHGLRGADADGDEAFCRALAGRCGLPFEVERLDVRRVAAQTGRSLEDAARRARYEGLERARKALAADRIAVGHTRDDQAETVLLKLLRGAGPRGLAGIYPRNGLIVRPLLELSREQVRTWLADKQIAHVEDATNQDVANPRNLVRHRVLPALETWFGPSVPEVLARTAEIARADEEWLAELTSAHMPGAVSASPGGVLISANVTATQPLALQRRVLLEALRQAGAQQPGLAEVETLRAVLRGETGGADLPGGVRADRNSAGVVLSSTGAAERDPAPFRYALPVPGRIWVPEARATVSAEGIAAGPPDGGVPIAQDGLVAAERIGARLFVRNWRPGDALRPAGLGGRKKLQDLFVDRKIPRHERHRLPLVVDDRDRVVWVPGLAVDEAYAVTAADSGVVVLRLTRQWGGPE